jgi:hypothetical protein
MIPSIHCFFIHPSLQKIVEMAGLILPYLQRISGFRNLIPNPSHHIIQTIVVSVTVATSSNSNAAVPARWAADALVMSQSE